MVEKSVKNSSKLLEAESTQEVERPLEGDLKATELKSPEGNQKVNEPDGDGSFRFRLEFDPMSIALFTLAIVTRFFRLSEPKNVV